MLGKPCAVQALDGRNRSGRPGGVALEEFEADEVETISWPDTVLVRGSALIRGLYGEYDFEHALRFLDVYARREEKWQLVASHVCDIVPDENGQDSDI